MLVTYLTKNKFFKRIFFVFYPIHFYVQFFIKVMKPFLELAANELKPKITYFNTTHFGQSRKLVYILGLQNKISREAAQKIKKYCCNKVVECQNATDSISRFLICDIRLPHLDSVAFLFAFVC